MMAYLIRWRGGEPFAVAWAAQAQDLVVWMKDHGDPAAMEAAPLGAGVVLRVDGALEFNESFANALRSADRLRWTDLGGRPVKDARRPFEAAPVDQGGLFGEEEAPPRRRAGRRRRG